MRCRVPRRKEAGKCSVCDYPLRTICLTCGAEEDVGAHECKVSSVPPSPFVVESAQLRTQLENSPKLMIAQERKITALTLACCAQAVVIVWLVCRAITL